MNSLTSSKIILSREREESNDTWLCVAAVAVGAAAAVNVNVNVNVLASTGVRRCCHEQCFRCWVLFLP